MIEVISNDTYLESETISMESDVITMSLMTTEEFKQDNSS
jgi:hypothetical protein